MTLKHDIRPIIIHVLIPWNKVTLYCQIVPMCVRQGSRVGTPNRQSLAGQNPSLFTLDAADAAGPW